MKNILAFLLLLTAFSVWAQHPFNWNNYSNGMDSYKTKTYGEVPVCDPSYLELSNLPPLRDQGTKGLCYAHSSLLLLEYQRCARANSPSACYSDKGSVLHLAKFGSRNGNAIEIGGYPLNLLESFKSTRKIARESCATYDKWFSLDSKKQQEIQRLALPFSDSLVGEKDFFLYLATQLKFSRDNNTRYCMAEEIVNAGISKNIADVMKVLENANQLSWQELRYKILVPEQCLVQTIQYPEYEVLKYPAYGEHISSKGIRDRIFQGLSKGYPSEISFCTNNKNGSCSAYHSTTVVGQRHVCGLHECKLQFRFQNSYGLTWQKNYDNGWVDAEKIADLATNNPAVITVIPKGESLNKNLPAPYYTASPIQDGDSQVVLSAKNKSTLNPMEKCWSLKDSSHLAHPNPVSPKPTQFYPASKNTNSTTIQLPAPSKIPGGVMLYICSGKGISNMVTNKPQNGMKCVPK